MICDWYIFDELLCYLFYSVRKSVKLESVVGYFGIGISVFFREDWVSFVVRSYL